nr:hypothetical protein [Tanacetum cinerariifolium]
MDHANPTFAKIPILDTRKFEQWKFRIQQYLQNEHYALWKVIEFGDSYKAPLEETGKSPASESSAKNKGRIVAITTEDMQIRRNDVKARTTLLLALPDEHQLQAIVSHLEFMDVEIKQDDLNQKFLTSLAPEWLIEKGDVHTASVQVSTVSTDVAAASLSHDTICAYIATQSNEHLEVKTEEREKATNKSYMANEEENHAFIADDEVLTEFALMFKSSSSSDNEVYDDSYCSKSCRKNTKNLNTKIGKLNEELSDCEIDLYNYKIGSQRSDKNKEGLGYTAVPPPPAQIYSPLKKDLSWTGLSEFVNDTVTNYSRPTPSIDASKCNKSEPQSSNFSVFEHGESTEKLLRPQLVGFGDLNKILLNKGNPQNNIDDKGYWDSGCSRHMTGNLSYLSEYEPYDGGYVSFGHRGGKITDFKLNDDTNVLLRTPRQHNMYSIDLNNIVPHKNLSCLVEKASVDERKQHKASCKTKLVNSISKPLHTLHMDLFGPTFVSSLNHKWYCLVVTDDFSRCDNREEFKNQEMNEFCTKKCIRREFSNARTPKQNGVEAVNTVCYVQNRVLVNKSQNKTPYKLFNSRIPAIGFLRPFGCHVMILNTLDHLGKFDAKRDECYFVGYSLSSKAFRVFNKKTKKIEENLHVDFLENKLIEKGAGPNWLFDIDTLTNSMYYVPVVVAGTSSANISGTKDVASQVVKKDVSSLRYIALLNWFHEAHLETSNDTIRNSDAQDNSQKEQDNADVPESSGISNPTATSKVPSADQVEHARFQKEYTRWRRLCIDFIRHLGLDHQIHSCAENLKALMHDKFQISAMGELTFFLELQVLQKKDGIFLLQDKYVGDIIKKFRYSDVRSANTPMDKENPWGKDRPVTPKECHLHAVKRIFRYLKGHPKLGLWYPKESPFNLVAYSDSDYGGATQDRKSTTRAMLAFCDYHNMAAILEKTEHNTDFHQIVDFLEASHIRIETMDQETKIIATVDGKPWTISESSLRRHLKLNDEEGISSLPDAELFENLSIIG